MLVDHDKYKLRVEFQLFRKNIVLYIGNDPQLITFGLSNETEDNYFVEFIDYDNILLEKVVKDVRHIQRVFSLGPMVIITTSNEQTVNGEWYGNYHVVGFDKLTFQEHLEMLNHTRCDRNYIHCPRYYKQKHWVLRFSEKWFVNGSIEKEGPTFLAVVNFSPPLNRESSRAHYLAMKRLFNIPKLNLNWDKSTECDVIPYRTGMK